MNTISNSINVFHYQFLIHSWLPLRLCTMKMGTFSVKGWGTFSPSGPSTSSWGKSKSIRLSKMCAYTGKISIVFFNFPMSGIFGRKILTILFSPGNLLEEVIRISIPPQMLPSFSKKFERISKNSSEFLPKCINIKFRKSDHLICSLITLRRNVSKSFNKSIVKI